MNRRQSKRWLVVLGLVALASMLLVTPVLAADIRADEVIVIDEDVDDDLYLFASSITVNATVHGDLIAAGGEITVNGLVEGDLWAAAGKVIINGTVADDVRFVGSDLKIGAGGQVGDDVFAGGFGLAVESGSRIGSDLYVAGFQCLLGGEVGGDVTAALSGLEISGHIGGDVKAEVQEPDPELEQYGVFMRMWSPYMPSRIISPGLHVDEDAQIDGELTYTSPVKVEVPDEAVGGAIVHQTPVPEMGEEPEIEIPEVPAGALTAAAILGLFIGWVLGIVRNFVTLLALGALLLWLVPKWLKEVVQHWKEKPAYCLAWGVAALLAFLVVVPLSFIVMFVLDIVLGILTLGGLVEIITSVILVLVAVLVVGFRILSVYITKVAFSYLIGWLILKRTASTWVEKAMGLIPLLIGLVIFVVVRSIPFVGGLFSLLVTVFGLGAMWLLAWVRIYKPRTTASS
jgi:hypothetical protein